MNTVKDIMSNETDTFDRLRRWSFYDAWDTWLYGMGGGKVSYDNESLKLLTGWSIAELMMEPAKQEYSSWPKKIHLKH